MYQWLELDPEPTFIRGLHNAEDLARIPQTDWVIASAIPGPSHPEGCLFLIDRAHHTVEVPYPAAEAHDLDAATYGDVAPPDPSIFVPHGLALRPGDDGLHTLYLVNHGGRESVEVFRVDARGAKPRLTWVGAVVFPQWAFLNDVAAHPEGGFVVTNFCTGGVDNLDQLYALQPCGNVLRWVDRHTPIAAIPGTDLSSPNGVEVSADGRWCFVAAWAVQELTRVSLQDPGDRTTVKLDFMPDNFTWTADGRFLLTTGQMTDPRTEFEGFYAHDEAGYPFQIVQLDPDTMETSILVDYAEEDTFGGASVAQQVDDEVWVGSPRAGAIAVFRRTA